MFCLLNIRIFFEERRCQTDDILKNIMEPNLQKSIFKPKQTCERVHTSSVVDSR